MNIKIADRLIELRKERGLSQEQLAEKLGVSRQAISKWERAEASPDTDNLITLANLYGISLDELLLNKINNEEPVQGETKKEILEEPKEETKDKKEVKIGPGGIHVNDGDKKVDIGFKGIHVVENGKELTVNKATIKRYTKNNVFSFTFYNVFTIFTALVILVVTTYLLLGFLTPRGWEVGWVLFLLIPVIESIFNCFKTKQVSKFDFTLLVTNIFCYIGMMWKIWHPTWVVFILIPVFYIIAETIDKKRGVYHNDNNKEIPSEFVVNLDEDSEVEIKENKEEN